MGLIRRKPRICVAQAEAANPLYLAYQKDFEVFEPIAARKTLASAIQIGNPVSFEKAVAALRSYDGVVEQASEAELVEACAEADRTGLFNCPHTGVALAALKKLVGRGLVKQDDRVVVISTAHGLKFVDFKVDYHRMQLADIVPENPNPPIDLPADYETVRSEMLREIDRRFGR
jgi:threonine synthase